MRRFTLATSRWPRGVDGMADEGDGLVVNVGHLMAYVDEQKALEECRGALEELKMPAWVFPGSP